ncbi:hypothetical protein [Clostridium sp. MD294]|uniref:hypothetical protein n=1 Tax=Clostridium sp. MD294 TaxID=97138 RepID=UPI00039EBD2D|nr:hypothetical protein [Clostridium sp. MD294]NDO47415.1 hypothetical protein [Clostridium sp. MD294]
MIFLITINFILFLNIKCKRVVGGTSLNIIDDLSWLNIINGYIMVKTKSRNFIFKVKNIDLFWSISGFLNIGLVLYDSKEFNFLSIGYEVHIISK